MDLNTGHSCFCIMQGYFSSYGIGFSFLITLIFLFSRENCGIGKLTSNFPFTNVRFVSSLLFSSKLSGMSRTLRSESTQSCTGQLIARNTGPKPPILRDLSMLPQHVGLCAESNCLHLGFVSVSAPFKDTSGLYPSRQAFSCSAFPAFSSHE